MTKNPSHMNVNRNRDENGEIRRKRDDTLVKNSQREYDVVYKGMRPEQKLKAVRNKIGIDDIKDINKYFRKLR